MLFDEMMFQEALSLIFILIMYVYKWINFQHGKSWNLWITWATIYKKSPGIKEWNVRLTFKDEFRNLVRGFIWLLLLMGKENWLHVNVT